MENNLSEITPDSEKKEPLKKRSAAMGFFIDTIETILLALVLFVGINAISSRVHVQNISMKPTLQSGDMLLINKLAYKLGKPHHGDIIVFHFQGNTEEDYIKRLIGLPGDDVKVENGIVTVNGYDLTEPYIAAKPNYQGEWIVPEGQFFVLGDNRNLSSDSHEWGFVDMTDVVGKALFAYWPFDRIKSFIQPDLVLASQ